MAHPEFVIVLYGIVKSKLLRFEAQSEKSRLGLEVKSRSESKLLQHPIFEAAFQGCGMPEIFFYFAIEDKELRRFYG